MGVVCFIAFFTVESTLDRERTPVQRVFDLPAFRVNDHIAVMKSLVVPIDVEAVLIKVRKLFHDQDLCAQWHSCFPDRNVVIMNRMSFAHPG